MTKPLHVSITHLTLDESYIFFGNPNIEHEYRVVMLDVLAENTFYVIKHHEIHKGPFHLHLFVRDHRLIFEITDQTNNTKDTLKMPLSPFRKLIKDYFTICDSYYAAVKNLTPHQIEAIDMARRALHNEGGQLMMQNLQSKIQMDLDTARRFFTLLCLLHTRAIF